MEQSQILETLEDELTTLKAKLQHDEPKIWLIKGRDDVVSLETTFQVASQIADEKVCRMIDVILARINHLKNTNETQETK
jgi:hypothetical protein